MSVKLTARVWACTDPELKDARLLTLLALADFANDACLAWPSVPTLSQRTRICERQVQRAIQWLVEQSYIEIAIKGNGRGNLTTYKVTVKGDMITPFNGEKGDTVTPIDAIKGDIPNVKGDIGDENYSHARREPLTTEPPKEEKNIAANAAPPAPAKVAKPTKSKRSRKSENPPNTSDAPTPTGDNGVARVCRRVLLALSWSQGGWHFDRCEARCAAVGGERRSRPAVYGSGFEGMVQDDLAAKLAMEKGQKPATASRCALKHSPT